MFKGKKGAKILIFLDFLICLCIGCMQIHWFISSSTLLKIIDPSYVFHDFWFLLMMCNFVMLLIFLMSSIFRNLLLHQICSGMLDGILMFGMALLEKNIDDYVVFLCCCFFFVLIFKIKKHIFCVLFLYCGLNNTYLLALMFWVFTNVVKAGGDHV